MPALHECISISHLSIYRPSSIVCVSVREVEGGRQEGGTTLWQVSIVNCQVVCCCHWQFANGIWQALSLIPARVGELELELESESTHRVDFMQIGNLRSVFDFEEALTSPCLSSPFVCPEVVKVAAQLTASSQCRRMMMTLVLMMSPL